MHVTPLLQRELRAALRRKGTFRMRLWAGGGGMVLTIWSILVWGGSSKSAGVILFYVFSFIVSVLCLFAGVFIASDSISRERREETLGFLYLSGLTATDVVLGKLSAAGLAPLYALIAIFPSLALCPLFGGVTGGEFWRTVLILLVTLFYSLAATLFASSFSRERRTAALFSLLVLVSLDPLWLWKYHTVTYATSPSWFWMVLAAFAFLSLLLLGSAAIFVKRSWRQNGSSGERMERKVARREIMPVLEASPVAWMMLRRRGSGRTLRWFSIVGLFAFFFFLITPGFGAASTFRLSLLFGVHLGCVSALLARAAYSFYNDKQEGTLELLLGTPLKNEEIFAGFGRFLFLQSGAFCLLLTVLDGLFSALLWYAGPRSSALFPVSFACILWFAFFGVRWVGIYRSLLERHPATSILTTFARLALVPLIAGVLCLTIPAANISKVLAFWVVSTALLSLFFAGDAHTKLALFGRELLLRPQMEKLPHIEGEWSFINWDEVLDEDTPRISLVSST